MSKPHRTAEKSRRGPGRHAAGEDPLKRKAIIKGAERVFMQLGFDAASMDDIARTAGVSKATLYVYFKDKTELFVAMIAVRREELWQGLSEILVEEDDLKTVLTRFGIALVKSTNTDWALRTVRIVMAVAERMPEVGQAVFEIGSLKLGEALAVYLDQQQAAGRLKMPHTFFAAVQFLELCNATVTRPRLFCAVRTEPAEEEIRPVVAGAVRVFLAAYGVRTSRA